MKDLCFWRWYFEPLKLAIFVNNRCGNRYCEGCESARLANELFINDNLSHLCMYINYRFVRKLPREMRNARKREGTLCQKSHWFHLLLFCYRISNNNAFFSLYGINMKQLTANELLRRFNRAFNLKPITGGYALHKF